MIAESGRVESKALRPLNVRSASPRVPRPWRGADLAPHWCGSLADMSTPWQSDPATTDPLADDAAPEVSPAQGGQIEAPAQPRFRSSIAFPYADLGDAQRIAEVMHSEYGGRCTIDQVAASLRQSTKSGAFRNKVSAAQLFGIVTSDRGQLSLTARGQRIVDKTTRHAALAEAFLAVDLYRAIFESHQGGVLPGDPGLQAEMVKLGVAPKQADRARQAFHRSADIAGFFRLGRERLVAPPQTVPADTMQAVGTPTVSLDPVVSQPVTPSGTSKVHPLLTGLMQELPAAGQDFPSDKRQDWLNAAQVIFRLVYGKVDDGKN